MEEEERETGAHEKLEPIKRFSAETNPTRQHHKRNKHRKHVQLEQIMWSRWFCSVQTEPPQKVDTQRRRAPHLLVGDGHRVLEDDPLDGLAAGRRGQRAVVDEVFVRGVRQEASRGEGRNLGALSWTADKTV